MFSPPIDIRQELQSSTPSLCPCRFVILATKKALNSHKLRDRHVYASQIQDTRQVHTYIRGILMRVASVGCFPGAWRWGSWHFQVASLHLQSSMNLYLSASQYFSFLSKRSGRHTPPAERNALYTVCICICMSYICRTQCDGR